MLKLAASRMDAADELAECGREAEPARSDGFDGGTDLFQRGRAAVGGDDHGLDGYLAEVGGDASRWRPDRVGFGVSGVEGVERQDHGFARSGASADFRGGRDLLAVDEDLRIAVDVSLGIAAQQAYAGDAVIRSQGRRDSVGGADIQRGCRWVW